MAQNSVPVRHTTAVNQRFITTVLLRNARSSGVVPGSTGLSAEVGRLYSAPVLSWHMVAVSGTFCPFL
jgi:hypothetical protein